MSDADVRNAEAAMEWCRQRGLSFAISCEPVTITTTIEDQSTTQTSHRCQATVGTLEDNAHGEYADTPLEALRTAVIAFLDQN